MALAGIAAGAHGLLIEVHARPETALSDGAQSLTPSGFKDLIAQLAPLAAALGKAVAVP